MQGRDKRSALHLLGVGRLDPLRRSRKTGEAHLRERKRRVDASGSRQQTPDKRRKKKGESLNEKQVTTSCDGEKKKTSGGKTPDDGSAGGVADQTKKDELLKKTLQVSHEK